MTEGIVRALKLKGRVWLAVGLMMTTVPAVFGQTEAVSRDVGAKTAQTESNVPEFEVASIKPSDPNSGGGGGQYRDDRVVMRGTTIKSLISSAYGIQLHYVFGGPGWIDSARYDVNAKVDDSLIEKLKKMTPKEKAQQSRLMMQALLKERFSLQVRLETKELPIYALVVAKNGPKFTANPPAKTNADGTTPKQGFSMRMMPEGQSWKRTMKYATMEILAGNLSYDSSVERMVVDETGLKGTYDFELKTAMNPDSQNASGSDVFTALQEQLGLKLEPKKGPVDTLVVEHVERPSEN